MSALVPSPNRARLDGWPNEVVGCGVQVPVVGGAHQPYAYLDNGASTPALRAAKLAVDDFLPWYSSVHRGSGAKSRLSTAAYERARERVRAFVNAGNRQTVVFVKNTTEGLNRLSLVAAERQMTIFSSIMEHHANLLPWRQRAGAIHLFQADPFGVIDEDDLRRQLRVSPSGPKLVAISGAYNVTGYTPPIHRLARLAHEHGAEILIDGAQLVAHRPVDLCGASDGEAIDYFVFSAHKIYAPFGAGVMIAPIQALGQVPALVGGGVVRSVSLADVEWNDLPEREEAGSPNVAGSVALGAALVRLEELGRPVLEAQETALTAYALNRLEGVPGLRVLGPPAGPDRVGVISFTLASVPHHLLAAALSYEDAIGVRSGMFCAHPGVRHLLKCQADASAAAAGDGAVRASLGLQNTRAEIDRLADALNRIATDGPRANYTADPLTGELRPAGWEERYPEALARLA